MNLWFKTKKKNKKSLTPTLVAGNTSNILLSGYTNNDALSLYSLVYAVVDRKSKAIAQLPINLYKMDLNSKFKEKRIIDNELSYLLKEQPELNRTPFIFWRLLIAHKEIYGNAYALIIRNKYMIPTELKILNPELVTPIIEQGTNELYYRVMLENGFYDVHNTNILHFPSVYSSGYSGISFIRCLRSQLGLKTSITDVARKQAESSIKVGGLLKLDANISQESKKAYQEQFKQMYSQDWASVMILEAGTEYERLKFEVNDLRQEEINKITAREVSMVSGIPLYMLGEGENKYNSIEIQNLDFIQNCITPDVVLMEQELKRKLLTRKQIEEGYYFKYNVNAVLRADMNTRADFYTKMVALGAMTLNEIRDLEDLSTYGELGDRPVVSLNYSFLDTLDSHERIQNKGGDKVGRQENENNKES